MTSGTSTSFEETWQHFQKTDVVHVSQGSQDEWSRGRAQFLAFIVRVSDHRIREGIAAFIRNLHHLPCLDLFPEDYWHITVKMVGFQVVKRTWPDEVLRQELGSLLYGAERALAGQPPFDVEIGPVNAFPDVVFLEVHDGGRLKTLHQRLLGALKSCPHFPHEGGSYLPHLTLGRYARQEGLAELKKRLASLRPEKVGTLAVRRVEFVKVWLTSTGGGFASGEGDYPEFDVIQPIVLGRPG